MKLALSREDMKYVVNRLYEHESRLSREMKEQEKTLIGQARDICEEALETSKKIRSYLETRVKEEGED